MISLYDQIGRQVELKEVPKRIVSLVPSQTELLFDLGLNNEVVGITKFCVHPPQWFQNKKKIGGTKSVKYELVKELKPDLIIANKEENLREQVLPLYNIAPVYTSHISTLEEALTMIEQVGALTSKGAAAQKIIQTIQQDFSKLVSISYQPRTAYLIWRDPYMSVGNDTFIHHLLTRCGFQNVFAGQSRYPATTIDELLSKHTELILLSSEPYPFREKHMDEIRQAMPHVIIQMVDGEIFSWYGSRLQYAFAYLSSLIENISQLIVLRSKS